MHRVHATCVALDGAGVLLRGPPGAGKSDLALRLLDAGARLVADDQVLLERRCGRVVARCPPPLAGLLEVRGLGIVPVPALAEAELALLVDLVAAVERLPEPRAEILLGCAVRALAVLPFEASAAAKVRLAVHLAAADISRAS